MFKQLLAVLFMCAAVLVGSTNGAQATANGNTESRQEKPTASDTVGQVMSATRQEEAAAKRQAIQDEVAQKKSAITDKLSGEKMTRCEQKEKVINTVLENRVLAAQRHLKNFSTIEQKLRDFVAEKNLDLDNAGIYASELDVAFATAEGAVNGLSVAPFACEEAAANAPGALVKLQISKAKQALKEYRTAIKNYAVAIKNAAEKTSKLLRRQHDEN